MRRHKAVPPARLKPQQARVTLAELWGRFSAAKTIKPSTEAVHDRVRRCMLEHFKPGTPIETIGPERAEAWVRALADSGLAVATRSKYLHISKQLFRRAVRWDLITRSPFEDIKPGPQVNPKRQRYITRAELEALLSACPDDEWRCILALARLGALRVPSELVHLDWDSIDFEAGRMVVWSVKTEGHGDGHQMRVVPIAPRLAEILRAARPEGASAMARVVPSVDRQSNLRTGLRRIYTKASLTPPPKPFVNMRASMATDWAQAFGGAAAAKFCGHGVQIAVRHYHQVPEDIFAKAAGSPSPSPSAPRP